MRKIFSKKKTRQRTNSESAFGNIDLSVPVEQRLAARRTAALRNNLVSALEPEREFQWFDKLPIEIKDAIIKFLSAKDLFSFLLVSKELRNLLSTPSMQLKLYDFIAKKMKTLLDGFLYNSSYYRYDKDNVNKLMCKKSQYQYIVHQETRSKIEQGKMTVMSMMHDSSVAMINRFLGRTHLGFVQLMQLGLLPQEIRTKVDKNFIMKTWTNSYAARAAYDMLSLVDNGWDIDKLFLFPAYQLCEMRKLGSYLPANISIIQVGAMLAGANRDQILYIQNDLQLKAFEKNIPLSEIQQASNEVLTLMVKNNLTLQQAKESIIKNPQPKKDIYMYQKQCLKMYFGEERSLTENQKAGIQHYGLSKSQVQHPNYSGVHLFFLLGDGYSYDQIIEMNKKEAFDFYLNSCVEKKSTIVDLSL